MSAIVSAITMLMSIACAVAAARAKDPEFELRALLWAILLLLWSKG